jgi:catechol 2,3-dioxygenase-like lactoylglutathione lyase family enzyme
MELGSRDVFAITLFVADPVRSRDFYAAALGISPVHEDDSSVAFKLPNLVLNLLAESAAGELLEPASPGAPGGGPRFELTIGVEDLDAAVAHLAGAGITLINGPIDRPWGPRTVSFADPDGYVWELAA